MKHITIGIHHQKGSFSGRWAAHLDDLGIRHKAVDCSRTDIVDQLRDCNALMWHWQPADPAQMLFARQLTYSLEAMGKKVFPDSRTAWHFDDKVGQKYLFEAIEAPLVPSYAFYDMASALKWARETEYPKVFKLRGGAGSSNVWLVSTKQYAIRLIRKAFGRGFRQTAWGNITRDHARNAIQSPSVSNTVRFCKSLVRNIYPSRFERILGKERGYAYFQEFIPNNSYDTRVITIGQRAFGIRRNVRTGDFRASGSGSFEHESDKIDIRCVKTAFEVSERLGSQCMAYDFVFSADDRPLLIEMSYGFIATVYDPCSGYWDRNLQWHSGRFVAQNFMVDDLIAEASFDRQVA